MQALEFETKIDKKGRIFLPEEFQHAYGKSARLLVLLPEQGQLSPKQRQPGSAKGILTVLSEDDEHLDDFEAYMP
jgi:bifunctional DNA-binding transcriptional regulator/antitoxin component of YhaV-PrlF toxin-antitoxin module